jgi:hypothetical protein
MSPRQSNAPLRIKGCIRRGQVVHLGSVPIDSGSGLGAEVAVPGVEIECTDAAFATGTLELHSPFDPTGGVVSHGWIVVLCLEGRTHHGGRSKVILGAPSVNTTDHCPRRRSLPTI